MNPTQEIARFITGFKVEDIPDQALEAVKMAFTDYTASILAGLDEACAVNVRRMICRQPTAPCQCVAFASHCAMTNRAHGAIVASTASWATIQRARHALPGRV